MGIENRDDFQTFVDGSVKYNIEMDYTALVFLFYVISVMAILMV